MNGQNTQLAAGLILETVETLGPAIAALRTSRSENRDLTDAELGGLFDAERLAAAKLDAAIGD